MPSPRPVRMSARGIRRRPARDRGASAIELTILAPMLLALIWLAIQYALYFQGRQVALAAAQVGDRVAREEAARVPAWQANAVNQAETYYNGLGTKVLGNGIVATARAIGNNEVQVTVTGQAASIMFGLNLPINETAVGPIECFRPDLNGGQLCPVA
jgi:Flp pilus assembly protein TadG